jgi:hypothetical protein
MEFGLVIGFIRQLKLNFETPNLEGQVPVFISLRNNVGQLYPQALDLKCPKPKLYYV